ncbi:endonuclease domain-containing 1 protein-like [Mytilus californianus]|uniref:endonuclease domain-containing 1 protein-like n=1 Tax=Mytilus californianus TaxID=6549 RepID=UPI002247ED14|nr:endonuclease domain-containing 1 protein-like [Mytilus californianus]XP_052061593.1 endonuclease domain-containing 1 protein-like [Mytilus californianus]
MKIGIIFLDLFIFKQHFLNVLSEVSEDFRNCRHSFYQDTPPYFNGFTNSVQICQRHRTSSNRFFAINYNSVQRIPHYSAYLIDSFDTGGSRANFWFLEPQLADRTFPQEIVIDNNQPRYRNSQALDADYKGCGYDRGHLNPSFYHSETKVARLVTNSLTNVAPQVADFNQGIWNKLEKSLYNAMNESCNFAGAKRYFITGVIPSSRTKISNDRVNVPDYFWTAMCCDSSRANDATERMMGWSAAFLGGNIINSSIYVYTIEDFLNFLARHTSSRRPQLFADYANANTHIRNCLFNQTQAATMVNGIIQDNARFYKQSLFNRICNSVYCAVLDRLG